MFSISAINDDDTRSQLEPLGPTKEAQEAKLMQKYQDALLHIHRKEHDVARTLLEAILHGTATASTPEQEAEGRQPHNSSSSMLQLRYLSLKNLGELLAKLDRCHASDAIRYYLQAAAMDDRDVVLWHRLGVLACRERHLAIARRAFEKGLQCSPRHWGCLQKLLEVLLAVGDERACGTLVSHMLLLDPSHSRASQVAQALQGPPADLELPSGIRLLPMPTLSHEQLQQQQLAQYEKVCPSGSNGEHLLGGSDALVEPDAGWHEVVPGSGRQKLRKRVCAGRRPFDLLEPRLGAQSQRPGSSSSNSPPAAPGVQEVQVKCAQGLLSWAALSEAVLATTATGGPSAVKCVRFSVQSAGEAGSGAAAPGTAGHADGHAAVGGDASRGQAAGGVTPSSGGMQGRAAAAGAGAGGSRARHSQALAEESGRAPPKAADAEPGHCHHPSAAPEAPLTFPAELGVDTPVSFSVRARGEREGEGEGEEGFHLSWGALCAPAHSRGGDLHPPGKKDPPGFSAAQDPGARSAAGLMQSLRGSEQVGEVGGTHRPAAAAAGAAAGATGTGGKEELPVEILPEGESTPQTAVGTRDGGAVELAAAEGAALSEVEVPDGGRAPSELKENKRGGQAGEGVEQELQQQQQDKKVARTRLQIRSAEEQQQQQQENPGEGAEAHGHGYGHAHARRRTRGGEGEEGEEEEGVSGRLLRFVLSLQQQQQQVPPAESGGGSQLAGKPAAPLARAAGEEGGQAAAAPLEAEAEAEAEAVRGFQEEYGHGRNSGAGHVVAALLEHLSHLCCFCCCTSQAGLSAPRSPALPCRFPSTATVLALERWMGADSATWSPGCSLFLAEAHLDQLQARAQEAGEHEMACSVLLCKAMEWAAMHAVDAAAAASLLPPLTLSLDQAGAPSAEETSERAGNAEYFAEWQFWARFHWASGRLALRQGQFELGSRHLQECAATLQAAEDSTLRPDSNSPPLPTGMGGAHLHVDGAGSLPPGWQEWQQQQQQAEEKDEQATDAHPREAVGGAVPGGKARERQLVLHLGHCCTDNVLSRGAIRQRLHDIQVELLVCERAPAMLAAGHFHALVELLAPILLPETGRNLEEVEEEKKQSQSRAVSVHTRPTQEPGPWAAAATAPPLDRAAGASSLLGADVAAAVVVPEEGSSQLVGLRTLLEACQRVGTRGAAAGFALTCHVKLLAAALRHAALSQSFRLAQPKNPAAVCGVQGATMEGEGEVEEDGEAVKGQQRLAQELALLSRFLQELPAEAAPSGSTWQGQRAALQLLLVQCIEQLHRALRGRPEAGEDARWQLAKASLVNAALSFARITLLTHELSVKEQVSLLVSLHGVLADRGACCCAAAVGEGEAEAEREEEGVFVKYVLKRLSALDADLRRACVQIASSRTKAPPKRHRWGGRRSLRGEPPEDGDPVAEQPPPPPPPPPSPPAGSSQENDRHLRVEGTAGQGGQLICGNSTVIAGAAGEDTALESGQVVSEALGSLAAGPAAAGAAGSQRSPSEHGHPPSYSPQEPEGSEEEETEAAAAAAAAAAGQDLEVAQTTVRPTPMLPSPLSEAGDAPPRDTRSHSDGLATCWDEARLAGGDYEGCRRRLGLDTALSQGCVCLYGLDLTISSQAVAVVGHRGCIGGRFVRQGQCIGMLDFLVPYAEAVMERAQVGALRGVVGAIHALFPGPPPRALHHPSPVLAFLDDPALDEDLLFNETCRDSDTCQEVQQQSEFPCHMPAGAPVAPASQEGASAGLAGNGQAPGSGRGVPGPLQAASIAELGKAPARTSAETSLPAEAPASPDGSLPGPTQAGTVGEADGAAPPSLLPSELPGGGESRFDSVYGSLYYLRARLLESSASAEGAGFLLTREGQAFLEKRATLFRHDLCYNPRRFASWFGLAKLFDEGVDLMLNDGSKSMAVREWRSSSSYMQRVARGRQQCRRAFFCSLALAPTPRLKALAQEFMGEVTYDSIQNVVPLYDQRALVPPRDAQWRKLCAHAFHHFHAASRNRPDWTHFYHMGKLSQKLERPAGDVLALYRRAEELCPWAVNCVYRLHATRLKLLLLLRHHCCAPRPGKAPAAVAAASASEELLEVVSQYCFLPETSEKIAKLRAEAEVSTVALTVGTSRCIPEAGQMVQNDQSPMGKEGIVGGYEACLAGSQQGPLSGGDEGGSGSGSGRGASLNLDVRGDPSRRMAEVALEVGSHQNSPAERNEGAAAAGGGAAAAADGDVCPPGRQQHAAAVPAGDQGGEAAMASSSEAQVKGLEWHALFDDGVAAMRACLDGDLKHFHKARFQLAKAYLGRGLAGDVERAKEELAFLFRTPQKPFSINLWEIDTPSKRSSRRASKGKAGSVRQAGGGGAGGKRMALEVALAESSRKWTTCVRRYLLFFLALCQRTGDVRTLELCYSFLAHDKKFGKCLGDIALLALGKYVSTLALDITHASTGGASPAAGISHLAQLESMFNVYVEHAATWQETAGRALVEADVADQEDVSLSAIERYMGMYLQCLEATEDLSALEQASGKIRRHWLRSGAKLQQTAATWLHLSGQTFCSWTGALARAMSSIRPPVGSMPCALGLVAALHASKTAAPGQAGAVVASLPSQAPPGAEAAECAREETASVVAAVTGRPPVPAVPLAGMAGSSMPSAPDEAPQGQGQVAPCTAPQLQLPGAAPPSPHLHTPSLHIEAQVTDLSSTAAAAGAPPAAAAAGTQLARAGDGSTNCLTAPPSAGVSEKASDAATDDAWPAPGKLQEAAATTCPVATASSVPAGRASLEHAKRAVELLRSAEALMRDVACGPHAALAHAIPSGAAADSRPAAGAAAGSAGAGAGAAAAAGDNLEAGPGAGEQQEELWAATAEALHGTAFALVHGRPPLLSEVVKLKDEHTKVRTQQLRARVPPPAPLMGQDAAKQKKRATLEGPQRLSKMQPPAKMARTGVAGSIEWEPVAATRAPGTSSSAYAQPQVQAAQGAHGGLFVLKKKKKRKEREGVGEGQGVPWASAPSERQGAGLKWLLALQATVRIMPGGSVILLEPQARFRASRTLQPDSDRAAASGRPSATTDLVEGDVDVHKVAQQNSESHGPGSADGPLNKHAVMSTEAAAAAEGSAEHVQRSPVAVAPSLASGTPGSRLPPAEAGAEAATRHQAAAGGGQSHISPGCPHASGMGVPVGRAGGHRGINTTADLPAVCAPPAPATWRLVADHNVSTMVPRPMALPGPADAVNLPGGSVAEAKPRPRSAGAGGMKRKKVGEGSRFEWVIEKHVTVPTEQRSVVAHKPQPQQHEGEAGGSYASGDAPCQAPPAAAAAGSIQVAGGDEVHLDLGGIVAPQGRSSGDAGAGAGRDGDAQTGPACTLPQSISAAESGICSSAGLGAKRAARARGPTPGFTEPGLLGNRGDEVTTGVTRGSSVGNGATDQAATVVHDTIRYVAMRDNVQQQVANADPRLVNKSGTESHEPKDGTIRMEVIELSDSDRE